LDNFDFRAPSTEQADTQPGRYSCVDNNDGLATVWDADLGAAATLDSRRLASIPVQRAEVACSVLNRIYAMGNAPLVRCSKGCDHATRCSMRPALKTTRQRREP
jgi:hypothetical protein